MEDGRLLELLPRHGRDGAGDDHVARVQHGNRVAHGHVRGHVVAQQAFHRVLGDQHAGEARAVDQRHLDLEDHGVVGIAEGLGIGRLAALLDQLEDVLCGAAGLTRGHGGVAALQGHEAVRLVARRADAGPPLAAAAEPGDVGDLGPVAGPGAGLGVELVGVGGPGGDLPGDAHQLLLVLDQAQLDLLLGDLGVALDGFLLAFDFLVTQIPEGQDDGGQEEQHRNQRAQGGKAVLAGRGLAAPPGGGQQAQGLGPATQLGLEIETRRHGADYPVRTGPQAASNPFEFHYVKRYRTIWKNEPGCATLLPEHWRAPGLLRL